MHFDLVVAGAGPAGCAAAIHAASRGLRVALIEKSAFPRDLPGEALFPNVDLLFAELGVTKAVSKAGFIRCPGWIEERSGARRFIPFGGPSGLEFGYQAWRSKLDAILLDRARRAGVTVVQPARSGKVLVTGGRVTGLEVDGQCWSCRFLVDASGTTRWLARSLGLSVRELSPRLVARYAYFREDGRPGLLPELRQHTSGWTWLARVKTDCFQCVQLMLPVEAGSARGPVLPAPPDLPPGVRFRGADVTWRLVPECAGAGFFLCGDAAAALDPSAASGVARAMTSGLKAAKLIILVAIDGMDTLAAADAYRRWCVEQFVGHARQVATRYAQLETPPAWLRGLESQFSQLEEHSSKTLANSVDSVITSS